MKTALGIISIMLITLPVCFSVYDLKQNNTELKSQIKQRDSVNEQNKKIHVLDSLTIDSLTNYKYNYTTNK